MNDPEMQDVDFLGEGEFIVLIDELCHLVRGSDLEIVLVPSILYLTNRRIYVRSRVEETRAFSVSLFQIKSLTQKDINDCAVLNIFHDDEPLRIFMPDNDRHGAFAEILTKIHEVSLISKERCDLLCMAYQRCIKTAENLGEFYKKYSQDPSIVVESIPKSSSAQNMEALQVIGVNPNRIIDALVGTFELSERLFFGILFAAIAVLSVLFRILPFGAWFFGILFILITRHGIRMLFSDEDPATKPNALDGKIEKRFKSLAKAYKQVKEVFKSRFLWENPRHTLETVMFLLACGLLFSCFDPATILALSMIVLAIVERWNPLGFGALTDMFSSLFDFAN